MGRAPARPAVRGVADCPHRRSTIGKNAKLKTLGPHVHERQHASPAVIFNFAKTILAIIDAHRRDAHTMDARCVKRLALAGHADSLPRAAIAESSTAAATEGASASTAFPI